MKVAVGTPDHFKEHAELRDYEHISIGAILKENDLLYNWRTKEFQNLDILNKLSRAIQLEPGITKITSSQYCIRPIAKTIKIKAIIEKAKQPKSVKQLSPADFLSKMSTFT